MLSEKLLVIKSRIAKIKLLEEKKKFAMFLLNYGSPLDAESNGRLSKIVQESFSEIREEIALLKASVSEL